MVEKDDVLLWFKNAQASSRLGALCRMLRCLNPFELRYLYTFLEDLLKDYHQSLKDAEKQANNFSKSSLDLDSTPEHPCSSFESSDVQKRADCLVTLALLSASNFSVANQVLYPVLSTVKCEHVADSSDLREEVLLMLYMAGNHPAFSFSERRVMWDKIDMLTDMPASSPDTDEDRGLLKKDRTREARQSSFSALDEDETTSTNWGDCDFVVPESLFVSGCQKSKGSGLFDVRFEYIFEVTWSDGGFNRCFKTYTDLFQFQNRLLNENPSAGGKGGFPRIIPFLPGKKPLTKSTRELAEKRLPEIKEYATKLTELPQDILNSQLVVEFFGSASSSSLGVEVDEPVGSLSKELEASDEQIAAELPHRFSTDTSEGSRPGSYRSPPVEIIEEVHEARVVTDGDLTSTKGRLTQSPVKGAGPVYVPRIGGGVVYYDPGETVNCSADLLDRHDAVPASRTPSWTTSSSSHSHPSGHTQQRQHSSSTRQHNSSGRQEYQRPSLARKSVGASSLDREHERHDSMDAVSISSGGYDHHSSGRHTEPLPRRSCSPSPSLRSSSSLARAGSVTSVSSRSDTRTFSSILDWLKALRLHKYAAALTDCTFEKLIKMSPEELERLDMTVGARAKLATHLEWMRKNGCLQLTLSCKVSSSENSADRASLNSGTHTRAESLASVDQLDANSHSSSVASLHSPSPAGWRDGISANCLPATALSASPSSHSLPENTSLGHGPGRQDTNLSTSITPHDQSRSSAPFNSRSGGPASAGGYYQRRSDSGGNAFNGTVVLGLKDIPSLRTSQIKLPPGQHPRQLHISSKGRRKPSSSSQQPPASSGQHSCPGSASPSSPWQSDDRSPRSSPQAEESLVS